LPIARLLEPVAKKGTVPFNHARNSRFPQGGEGDSPLFCHRLLTSLVVKGLPPAAPFTALDLFDYDPCHGTHVFAFDRYHRVGELASFHCSMLRSLHRCASCARFLLASAEGLPASPPTRRVSLAATRRR